MSAAGGAERLVEDYEAIFEPLTACFCETLLAFAGGVDEGDRVIDVAAGTGALSLPIARAGAFLLACDVSHAAVRRLADKLGRFGPRARAVVLDGQALDIPDQSFDAAFSAFGVMLFPDFRAGLRELARVTRFGGRIGLAVWAQPEGSPAAGPFRAAFATAFPGRPLPPLVPGVATLSDPAMLRQELEAANCADVRIRLAEFPWAVPTSDWVGKNSERLFRDHPSWTGLSGTDRARLRDALLEEVSGLGPTPIRGRAWLAVARRQVHTPANSAGLACAAISR